MKDNIDMDSAITRSLNTRSKLFVVQEQKHKFYP